MQQGELVGETIQLVRERMGKRLTSLVVEERAGLHPHPGDSRSRLLSQLSGTDARCGKTCNKGHR
jgi:hypothetical protein